ncbi:SDR family NAD(P)-dependent oxidoreductase [Photobacterium atrarenae]|uniref:SDR family NAD(P)-dependent oxidoreductase n=1 Tax=Photobacterium atrarenae TaxID=865757 RepID=A0ABY5GK27_9GAMM|nr:SDR family NAD(P)-dependent oxidoreductase [Photobacterium atrarenae]UTV29674.1 SDR family NAD(P)-dependent oxidoreductase [Photobacterium atrarenae]
MNYHNKTVLITGASPDFGQTLAIQFAKAQANLILTARTQAKAEQTAALVHRVSPHCQIQCYPLDITQPEQIAALTSQLREQRTTIDLLINNASYWPPKSFLGSDDLDILQTMNSTATGSMLLTKHLLPLIEKSDAADIVFINSTASLPNDGHPTSNDAFSAAKAAQSTFADRLRTRLRVKGIRVIAIYPNDFDNPSPLNEADWHELREASAPRNMTARNVFNALRFALEQDRKCSVDKIILNNNAAG